MAQRHNFRVVLCACAVAGLFDARHEVRADDTAMEQQLQQLREQNQALQEQLRKQQGLIDSLTHKVNEIQESSARSAQELDRLTSEQKDAGVSAKGVAASTMSKLSISGEAGVGFFNTGSKGMFPNSEFRVDEARLFIEAPVQDSVYFFGELNLMTREALDLSLQLGECYLDFENVSQVWHQDRMLNVRIGRMHIPFGEEYMSRYAIDNPLISHSLSDFWGVDEGIELYGSVGRFSYVVAVQNGGPSGVRDFNGDKSVAGRLAYDPAKWLHLSVSGMRTGDISIPDDSWSELWFANGWLLPLGSGSPTRFHANLVEGDVEWRWRRGHLKAFGGCIRQDDNDSNGANGRDIYYYSVEALHDIVPKLYAAVRFSQIFASGGYPIAGNGNMENYLFSGGLTKELWRWSLGFGYRMSRNLVLKAEYALERGRQSNGQSRNNEDLFAFEAAFRF